MSWATPRVAVFLCMIGSAALLGGAHLFEAFGYVPCPLCLHQREVHWVALAVGAVALAFALRSPRGLLTRILVGLLAAVYLGSVILAVYHAGVEYHFWQGPPCAVESGIISGDDLLASLSNPSKAVPCDKAAWTLFGISMAGYNALASLVLFIVAVAGAATSPRRGMFH